VRPAEGRTIQHSELVIAQRSGSEEPDEVKSSVQAPRSRRKRLLLSFQRPGRSNGGVKKAPTRARGLRTFGSVGFEWV